MPRLLLSLAGQHHTARDSSHHLFSRPCYRPPNLPGYRMVPSTLCYSSRFGLSARFEKFDIQFIGETATMDYRKRFVVEPGARVRLGKIDPAFTDKHESHDTATSEIEKHVERMAKLQYLLYADGNQSLLYILHSLYICSTHQPNRHFSASCD